MEPSLDSPSQWNIAVTIEPWDSRAGGYQQTINLADGFADALKSEASNNLLMQLDIRSRYYQDSSAYPSCVRCRNQTGSDMLLMSPRSPLWANWMTFSATIHVIGSDR